MNRITFGCLRTVLRERENMSRRPQGALSDREILALAETFRTLETPRG